LASGARRVYERHGYRQAMASLQLDLIARLRLPLSRSRAITREPIHDAEAPMTPHAEQHVARSRLERDVLAGLSRPQKSLPCQYFYDASGSQLFEEITSTDEYYPTRTEIAILKACGGEIAGRTAPDTALVEFGSGSSVKTGILLDAAPALRCYVPIDVSPSIMEQAIDRLRTERPQLEITPVIADFATDVVLPPVLNGRPRLGFFAGSTIGNFGHEAAVGLLARFRALLGPASRLILGADLRKAPSIVVPAYNDARGLTARFNLNLLVRINRELGGTFDLHQFEHLATYDIEAGRIDMWLVSRRDQVSIVAGRRFTFAAGERIHTEVSQKYSVEEMQGLARRAGWQPIAVWIDPGSLFSVHELRAAP
jgi:dimethylhistidine N-methyltransferase